MSDWDEIGPDIREMEQDRLDEMMCGEDEPEREPIDKSFLPQKLIDLMEKYASEKEKNSK